MGRGAGVPGPGPTQELEAQRGRGGEWVKRKLSKVGAERAVGAGSRDYFSFTLLILT